VISQNINSTPVQVEAPVLALTCSQLPTEIPKTVSPLQEPPASLTVPIPVDPNLPTVQSTNLNEQLPTVYQSSSASTLNTNKQEDQPSSAPNETTSTYTSEHVDINDIKNLFPHVNLSCARTTLPTKSIPSTPSHKNDVSSAQYRGHHRSRRASATNKQQALSSQKSTPPSWRAPTLRPHTLSSEPTPHFTQSTRPPTRPTTVEMSRKHQTHSTPSLSSSQVSQQHCRSLLPTN